MKFRIECVDADGKKRRGIVSAESVEEATAKAKSKGLSLTSIIPADDPVPPPPIAAPPKPAPAPPETFIAKPAPPETAPSETSSLTGVRGSWAVTLLLVFASMVVSGIVGLLLGRLGLLVAAVPVVLLVRSDWRKACFDFVGQSELLTTIQQFVLLGSATFFLAIMSTTDLSDPASEVTIEKAGTPASTPEAESNTSITSARTEARPAPMAQQQSEPGSPVAEETPIPGFLHPQELEIGQVYFVSEQTPLMPSHSPADPLSALQQMKQIPQGGGFQVLEIYDKKSSPWYKATAFDQQTDEIGTGWINSLALFGQHLQTQPLVASGSKGRSTKPAKKWWSGGTLHGKTALDWQLATPEDKLATCADLIVTMWKHGDRPLRTTILNDRSTVDDVRPFAEELVVFLDKAFEKNPDPKQNSVLFTNQTVAGTALAGMSLMGWMRTPDPSAPDEERPNKQPGDVGVDGAATATASDTGQHTVPASVMSSIKQRAQKEWPDDYQMQKFEMEQQTEGYLAVANYSAESFPKAILSTIINNARTEWPDDYQMQEHEIDEEVQAFRAIRSYQATGVPPNVLKQIKSAALREWRDDYSMQKYQIDEQVKAYRSVGR